MPSVDTSSITKTDWIIIRLLGFAPLNNKQNFNDVYMSVKYLRTKYPDPVLSEAFRLVNKETK